MNKLLVLISIVAVLSFAGCDMIKVKKKDKPADNGSNVEAVVSKPSETAVIANEPTEKELKLSHEVDSLNAEISRLNGVIGDKNVEIVKLRGTIDTLNGKVTEMDNEIIEIKNMQQILFIVIIASVVLNLILIVSLLRRKKPHIKEATSDTMPYTANKSREATAEKTIISETKKAEQTTTNNVDKGSATKTSAKKPATKKKQIKKPLPKTK